VNIYKFIINFLTYYIISNMAKNKSLRKQKTYKMKGCSRRTRRTPLRTRSFLSGGNNLAKAYPSQPVPPANGVNFINSGNQKGGNCGCGLQMSGGNGVKYPNGLVGSPINVSTNELPGVNGIPGDRNYYDLNKYPTDVQLAIQPSPLVGGKRRNRGKKSNKGKRGGATSNLLFQDLVNLGRQFQYGLGSAYNGINGYPASPNPMPWKDQIVNPNPNSLATLKSTLLV
jgi:hypothetical protein